ncbi:dTDP-6-deoxy-L-hexose 3-O-methyltransferase [Escherichia coli]|uniref:dTDP-6-deoxy-L-hexose 3-O-methyltransferase n=1 Tax=Escherichia coli TaxID=562 RepID=UPI00183D95AC|nr:dTDP-6-deoxy-L-hexose 3-O-methyltransferase [Escherichia coli]MEC9731181.1 dTDP-6-deoxy-L-hexose 3-O-methyltransferase [Escherichia marmotae]EFA4943856.1 dTDP-6-deoxy-L-hexose 3-O-methyltransferase [Escherichia coli]EIM2895105.1 dTDP-6-deoxy-L-hexose 3-O-methyltransferase [Escherichia coli]EIQ2079767.1 dTDP-6-deoxy-L-hexose 3-O-methyltransferase [Escherichia coli]
MTTITRENAEIKSFITGFLSEPAHDNQSSNSLLADVFRIALASLEAEPVAVNDDMAYAFHHALSDSSPGADEVEEIKAGLRAAFANVTTQPAPVVPEFETWFNSQESGRSICSTQIRRSLQEISWNACRAAMLHAGNFREIPETSTNSPVTPTLLPGGFTVEDAKELHEDLVRSHISQALSGEKMKKKDRDADLRWIHGVIVQAAWFVKASLEALPEPPQEVNQ